MRLLAFLTLLAFCQPSDAQAPTDTRSSSAGSSLGFTDVSLPAGPLTVQLLTSEGRPVANSIVEFRYRDRAICRAKSDKAGRVLIRKLRPGIHTVHTAQSSGVLRLWKAGTAPEGSVESLALVLDNNAQFRGQIYVPPPGPGIAPLAFGTTITTAALIAAAIEKGNGSGPVVSSSTMTGSSTGTGTTDDSGTTPSSP